jgi:hypothetical protein
MNTSVRQIVDTAPRQRRLLLLGRLQDAEDDYATARREACEGVCAAALRADNDGWEEIGAAIAGLARLIGARCASSLFCDARPDVELVAARLSEAVDDQFDPPSWGVVDAAARLAAVEAPR